MEKGRKFETDETACSALYYGLCPLTTIIATSTIMRIIHVQEIEKEEDKDNLTAEELMKRTISYTRLLQAAISCWCGYTAVTSYGTRKVGYAPKEAKLSFDDFILCVSSVIFLPVFEKFKNRYIQKR